MGGCQNYGPFLGTVPKKNVPYYNKDPKRDHDSDNHPYRGSAKKGSYCMI